MNMKSYMPIILLIWITLFLSCNDHSNISTVFDKATSLMETAPDSAYTLLQGIDAEKLASQNHRARYALLYTQAQDKNYIDKENDSLINIAAEYYRSHGDVRPRFLSLYYKGRVHFNAGDYLNAMLAYTKAEELVDELQDDYYAGMLYYQIGDIYMNSYDYPKSLESYRKAEECYKNSGKDLHRIYAMLGYSDIYYNMNDYEKSDSVYQVIISEAENLRDSALIGMLLGNRMMTFVRKDQMLEAEKIFVDLKAAYDIEERDSHFWACVVEIYLAKGDLNTADLYMKKSWDYAKNLEDSVDCYITSSIIHKARNDYKSALRDYEAGILLQDKSVRKNLQQPVLTIQRDYLTQELEIQNLHLRETKWRNNLYWTLTIGASALVILLFYAISKKKKKETVRMHLAYEELRNTLSNNHTEMSNVIQKMFDIHFSMIDKFGGLYYIEADENKSIDKKLRKEVELFLTSYADGNGYQEIERIVDCHKENVMSLLRSEIKLKNERDYQMICFHLIGFSAHTISVLIKGLTPDNIYQKRTRLKRIIKESEAPHRELFLRLLYMSDAK